MPMTADEIIRRIQRWQADPRVHPLTCGNDSSHARLVPVKEGDAVLLRCQDCDYRQAAIPADVVYALQMRRNPHRPG